MGKKKQMLYFKILSMKRRNSDNTFLSRKCGSHTHTHTRLRHTYICSVKTICLISAFYSININRRRLFHPFALHRISRCHGYYQTNSSLELLGRREHCMSHGNISLLLFPFFSLNGLFIREWKRVACVMCV